MTENGRHGDYWIGRPPPTGPRNQTKSWWRSQPRFHRRPWMRLHQNDQQRAQETSQTPATSYSRGSMAHGRAQSRPEHRYTLIHGSDRTPPEVPHPLQCILDQPPRAAAHGSGRSPPPAYLLTQLDRTYPESAVRGTGSTPTTPYCLPTPQLDCGKPDSPDQKGESTPELDTQGLRKLQYSELMPSSSNNVANYLEPSGEDEATKRRWIPRPTQEPHTPPMGTEADGEENSQLPKQSRPYDPLQAMQKAEDQKNGSMLSPPRRSERVTRLVTSSVRQTQGPNEISLGSTSLAETTSEIRSTSQSEHVQGTSRRRRFSTPPDCDTYPRSSSSLCLSEQSNVPAGTLINMAVKRDRVATENHTASSIACDVDSISKAKTVLDVSACLKVSLNIHVRLVCRDPDDNPVRSVCDYPSVEQGNRRFAQQTDECCDPLSPFTNLPRCLGCSEGRQEACTFRNLRAIPTSGTEEQRQIADDAIDAYTFIPYLEADPEPQLPQHGDLNRPLDFCARIRNTFTPAEALLPSIKEALQHVRQGDVLFFPRELEFALSCDFCKIDLFAASYMCRRCGQEYCLACHETMVGWQEDPARASQPRSDERECLLQCSKTGDGHASHSARDLIAISRFSEDLLRTTSIEMEKVVEAARAFNVYGDLTVSDAHGDDDIDTPIIIDDVVSRPTVYLDNLTMTEDEFIRTWRKGQPLVVTNVSTPSRWDPETFIRHCGNQSCTVVACQPSREGDYDEQMMSIEDFVGSFEKSFLARRPLFSARPWKLKDWPPTEELREALPELDADFNACVPMPDYTRRNGSKNLSSYFPKNANVPDLGPKLFVAHGGRHKRNGQGTTKLHMDMADAVNIMLYTNKNVQMADGEAVALWDIFRPEDAKELRAFLRRHYNQQDGDDPIHAQIYYLTDGLLQKLYTETGVYPYRIRQRQDEAVFVPAGCAHQVCNLTDCCKVAVDFLSPFSVKRCLKLAEEFRTISGENRASWKPDVLRLKTQLWYAWLTCRAMCFSWALPSAQQGVEEAEREGIGGSIQAGKKRSSEGKISSAKRARAKDD